MIKHIRVNSVIYPGTKFTRCRGVLRKTKNNFAACRVIVINHNRCRKNTSSSQQSFRHVAAIAGEDRCTKHWHMYEQNIDIQWVLVYIYVQIFTHYILFLCWSLPNMLFMLTINCLKLPLLVFLLYHKPNWKYLNSLVAVYDY